MALTIKKRFVTNFGPVNVEVIEADADNNIETFESSLSRVDGIIVQSAANTTSPEVSEGYVDGKSSTVTVVGRLTSGTAVPIVILLFGY